MSAIVLAGAIPAEVIAQIRARLAGARFVPGRETAVGGAAVVKHNLQLARGEPAEERAVELLVGALQAHAQFQAATWPDGNDAADDLPLPRRDEIRRPHRWRDHGRAARPASLRRRGHRLSRRRPEYDGGELVIDTAGLPQAWKGAAGDIISYPADTLHRVAEVTRGVRDVAVLWVQSLVRDPGRRRILFDMKSALDALEQMPGGPSAQADAIRRSYFNLIRMWI